MKRSLRHTLMAAATLAAFGASAQAPKLATEKDKVSYMVGMQVGSSLAPIKDEIDLAVVLKAIESTLKGEAPALTQEEVGQRAEGAAVVVVAVPVRVTVRVVVVAVHVTVRVVVVAVTGLVRVIVPAARAGVWPVLAVVVAVLVRVSHHCYPAAKEGERQCWPSR